MWTCTVTPRLQVVLNSPGLQGLPLQGSTTTTKKLFTFVLEVV